MTPNNSPPRRDVTPNASPPAGTNLDWRPLQPGDLVAISALATVVLDSDGGLPLAATPEFLQARYLRAPATLGGWHADGALVACATVQLPETQHDLRASIVGQVHPNYRRRGLGTYMIAWSIAQARLLMAGYPSDRARTLTIASESLTEPAARLYERYGFAQEFGETVMRRDLARPLPDDAVPSDVTLATWSPGRAGQFFEVYQDAFRERPGFPGWSFDEWLAWITDDETFLPDLSLLASRDRRPLGYVVCAEEWIEQVGVRPEERGRGLASALVAEVLRRFRAAGAGKVMLDVNINNPGAERVYARLGFEVHGHRGRYVLQA